MSKKTDTTEKTQQPAYIDELLKNGTTTLTAKTPEELAEMLNDIPADCSYMAGAVGKNIETGAFSLRIDLNSKL